MSQQSTLGSDEVNKELTLVYKEVLSYGETDQHTEERNPRTLWKEINQQNELILNIYLGRAFIKSSAMFSCPNSQKCVLPPEQRINLLI